MSAGEMDSFDEINLTKHAKIHSENIFIDK